MSAVTEYVRRQRLLKAISDKGGDSEGRITVRIDPVHYLKLLRLSERLTGTKSGIAGDLLNAAIDEAWQAATSDMERRFDEMEGIEPEDEARWLLGARDTEEQLRAQVNDAAGVR